MDLFRQRRNRKMHRVNVEPLERRRLLSVSLHPAATAETPFHGVPFALNQTIEAEDFDNGGEGVAYHDTTIASTGSAPTYRPGTAVDVQLGGSNGYDVGYCYAGEWINYTIAVPQAGTYALQASVGNRVAGGVIHVSFNGANLTGSMSVPNTGGWKVWQTITSQSFTLPAGTTVMSVHLDRNASDGSVCNLDSFKLVPVATPPPDGTLSFSWKTDKNSPTVRLEAAAIAVNGKLYAFGGYKQNKPWLASEETDVYDPAANTWTHLADEPQGLTHAAAATDGRYVYLAGGYVSNYATGHQTFATVNVWRFDTVDNAWSAMPALPAPRAAGGMVLLNGQLHYLSGTDLHLQGVKTHYVLDLNDPNAKWTTFTSLPISANHTGAVVLNGKIYIVGGQTQSNDKDPEANVVYWDPANPGVWGTAASLPQPRSHLAAVAIDGKIVVLGGWNPNSSFATSILVYDPTADAWTTDGATPSARCSPAADVVGDTIILTTGMDTRFTLRPETWTASVTLT